MVRQASIQQPQKTAITPRARQIMGKGNVTINTETGAKLKVKAWSGWSDGPGAMHEGVVQQNLES